MVTELLTLITNGDGTSNEPEFESVLNDEEKDEVIDDWDDDTDDSDEDESESFPEIGRDNDGK